VGYLENHPENTYRFYNPKTKKIIISRDITWLNKNENSTTNRFEEIEVDKSSDMKEDTEETKEEKTISKSRLTRELKGLDTFYNRINENMSYALISAITSTPGEPETYEEAMESKEHDKWKEAIELELTNMEKRKVWEIIDLSELSQVRKLLSNKWTFKVKKKKQLIQEGLIELNFIRTTENYADMFTKNVTHDKYMKFTNGIGIQKNENQESK
jgi:hypothetical protein